MEGTDLSTRPLRSDAERNLVRMLDAAHEAFAEQGLSASVEEIARRAGVGKGTVFRRFPTKQHLISAVMVHHLNDATELAASLCKRPDGYGALRDFMLHATGKQARDRGFFEGVAASTYAQPEVVHAKQQLIDQIAVLLARAQAEGGVREDVGAEDILLLGSAAVQAAAAFHARHPELWQRYLGIAIDGLRAETARPLSQPAPSLEDAYLSPELPKQQDGA